MPILRDNDIDWQEGRMISILRVDQSVKVRRDLGGT